MFVAIFWFKRVYRENSKMLVMLSGELLMA